MQRIGPKIALRGFKPGANGAAHVLGELESAVMEILWKQLERSVTEGEDDYPHGTEFAPSGDKAAEF